MNKIVAKVKFNDEVGLILEKDPVFTYKRHGNLIIGTDETNTFHRIYIKNLIMGGGSFGGRPFYLELDDGEIIDDKDGVWWDGGYERAEQILGYSLTSVPLNDLDSIKDIYVFYGGITANQLKLESLKDKYKGTLYDYKEYQDLIKNKERDELVEHSMEIMNDFDEKVLYHKFKEAMNHIFELDGKDTLEEIRDRIDYHELRNRNEEPLFFEKNMLINNIKSELKSNNCSYLTNKQIDGYLKEILDEEDSIFKLVKAKDFPYITKEKLEILGDNEEIIAFKIKQEDLI